MKILFCIGSLKKGGAERVLTNLANYFSNTMKVIIVTTVDDEIEYKLQKQIEVKALSTKEEKKKNMLRIKKLYRIVKEEKPDIILSFLPEPSYRVLLLKKFIKNIPIIVSIRNDPKTEYANFKRKILMRMLYPFADAFVFQTKEAQQYFKKRIINKSVVIPNPIQNKFLSNRYNLEERENIIISVGRLEKQKNQELLIDAFYDIHKEIEEYKLYIYGEGSLRDTLTEKIKKLGMSDKIFLPGKTDDIISKMNRAKLFVLSSNYEGMPNALMEAMALGIPSISTDCPCGGSRILINNNENGFLVKVNDKEELADKMKEVLLYKSENELKELSFNAHKKLKMFSEEKIDKIWYKYVLKIIQCKNKRKG